MNKNNKRLIGTSVLIAATLAFGQTAWAEDQIYLSGNDNRTINSSIDTYSVVLTGSSNLVVNGNLNVLLDPDNENNYNKYGSYYSANSHIGDGFGANSTATVNGFGTWDNSYNLYVGSNGGTGTFNVKGDVITGNSGHIGADYYGSTGIANVTGSWSAAEQFYVGGSAAGSGTLNITDYGLVQSRYGVNVGYNGAVNVDGRGSALITSKVDLSDGGELTVSNGGAVGRKASVDANYVDLSINNSPYLSANALATAVIKGEGSSWTGFDINIGTGNTGDGTESKDAVLIVKDGGAMSAYQVTIGNSGMLSMDGGQLTGLGSVTNYGVISLNDSLIKGNVTNHGVLLGDQGTIEGNVTNHGLLSPGNSPGVLTITGDLSLASDSTLLMEIFGPTAYDQLIVGGNFVAGGVLELDFDGYVPEFDVPYNLFQVAGGMSGDFSEIRYLNLAEDFDTELLSLDFSNGMFRLTVGNNDDPVIPGDPGNNTVPEPSSGLLIALGGLVMLMLRRRSFVTGSLA